MWIAHYMKIKFVDNKKNKTTKIKSEITSWNAYKKLTDSEHWEGLVRQIYKHHKHKESLQYNYTRTTLCVHVCTCLGIMKIL